MDPLWFFAVTACLVAGVLALRSQGIDSLGWHMCAAVAGVVVLAVDYAEISGSVTLVRHLASAALASLSIVWFALRLIRLGSDTSSRSS